MPTVAPARNHLAYASAIVITGLLAALMAIIFRGGLHFVFTRVLRAPNVLRAFQSFPPVLRVAIPALGGALAAALGVLASRGAGGHGVAEILEAVVLGRGRISLRTSLLKAVASFFAIVTGGSHRARGPADSVRRRRRRAAGERLACTRRRGRALVAAGHGGGLRRRLQHALRRGAVRARGRHRHRRARRDLAGVASPPRSRPRSRAPGRAAARSTARARFTLRVADRAAGLRAARAARRVRGAGVHAPARLRASAPSALRVAAAVARGARRLRSSGCSRCGLPDVTGNGYEPLNAMLDGRSRCRASRSCSARRRSPRRRRSRRAARAACSRPRCFLGAAIGGLLSAARRRTSLAPAPGFVGGYALVGMAATTAATTHAPMMAAVLVFELSRRLRRRAAAVARDGRWPRWSHAACGPTRSTPRSCAAAASPGRFQAERSPAPCGPRDIMEIRAPWTPLPPWARPSRCWCARGPASSS